MTMLPRRQRAHDIPAAAHGKEGSDHGEGEGARARPRVA
jgi:hypothetical protein